MPRHRAPDIAQEISRQITAGLHPAGSQLPNERSLADHYGVARNTIRNALALIEEQGLITRHVGRGTVVKGPPNMELKSLVEKISGAAPIDILNLRLIIEPHATALAAVTASAQELGRIAEANEAMLGSDTQEGFERWDNEVHGRIFDACRNDFLIALHKILSVIRSGPIMQDLRRRSFTSASRQIYCAQHEELLDALRHRDSAAAASAMRTHLLTRRRSYFGE